MNNHTAVEVATIPACDLCGKPAVYDGRTVHGPWAYMCQGCFDANGVGLGLGNGQRLLKKETTQ